MTHWVFNTVSVSHFVFQPQAKSLTDSSCYLCKGTSDCSHYTYKNSFEKSDFSTPLFFL